MVQGSDGENLTVADANSVWVAQRYALQQQYSQALAEYFQAQVEPITTAEVSAPLGAGRMPGAAERGNGAFRGCLAAIYCLAGTPVT